MSKIDACEFPTYEEMGKKVAERALDEFLYDGKSIREWMQIIASEDCISRQAVEEMIKAEMPERGMWEIEGDKEKETVCEVCVDLMQKLSELQPFTPQQKTGHCKDCKWWKDSDGAFRRGISAESKCHLNTDVVYEGLGYCYMFEPKERNE